MQLNFDDLPISVIEEVEIATGYPLEELFEDDNKSPFRKRAMAYLSARSNGVQVTWQEMGEKTVAQLVEFMSGDDDADPKEE